MSTHVTHAASIRGARLAVTVATVEAKVVVVHVKSEPFIVAIKFIPETTPAGVKVTTCATHGKLVVVGVSDVNVVPAVFAVRVITLPATLVV